MTVAAASDVEPAPARRGNAWVLLPLTILAIVALSVGLIARWQATSTGKAEGGYFDLFFSDPIHLKAWFATAAALLACFQLFTAAWIFRKLAREGAVGQRRSSLVGPPRVRLHPSGRLPLHLQARLSKRHSRVLLHSLLGSAFFGAYAAKVLIIRMRRYPVWVIPTAGGLLFTTLIVVWYTSALWFFQIVGESI